MIELNGHVNQIFRSAEKSPQFETGKDAQAKGKASRRVASSGPAPAPHSASSVINFEYVPSGRLNLNQHERQRLIDFFQ